MTRAVSLNLPLVALLPAALVFFDRILTVACAEMKTTLTPALKSVPYPASKAHMRFVDRVAAEVTTAIASPPASHFQEEEEPVVQLVENHSFRIVQILVNPS